MKGVVNMRMGRCRQTGEEVCRWLNLVARSRNLVSRSIFGFVLLAARCAADGPRAFLLALREISRGPASAGETRRLREEGGYFVPADAAIDSASVFPALLLGLVKPPSENSTAGHQWSLADQLRTKQIEDLLWCDARGMRAGPMAEAPWR